MDFEPVSLYCSLLGSNTMFSMYFACVCVFINSGDKGGIIKTSAEESGTYSKACNFQIFYQPRTQATFVPKSTLGISTHRAKHANIIKLNAQVNNKWQKSGKSTVAHAIMALFKIFDSCACATRIFPSSNGDPRCIIVCNLILNFVSNM